MEELASSRPLFWRGIEYDAVQRRLWIMGQRCHHGATGAVLAAGTLVGGIAGAFRLGRVVALTGAATLLMAHDWKDRSIWFERGHGSQP